MNKLLINGQWYKINGTPCQYNDGLFFYETEDGTKFFHAWRLNGTNIDIEPIKNHEKTLL